MSVVGRRKSARFSLALPAEMRTPTKKFHYRGETAAVGEGGCYIEVLETLRPETTIEVVLWLGTEKICAQAEVVTNDPHMGNGLRFVRMEATAAEKLRQFLKTAAQENTQRTPTIATPSIFDVTIAAYRAPGIWAHHENQFYGALCMTSSLAPQPSSRALQTGT
jgi:PilZ domain